MNILLIIVLAILIVNGLIGMKAGLIKTVFSLFSMIIAVVLTIWLSPYVNHFMRNNDKIHGGISTGIEKMLPFSEEEAEGKDQDTLINGLSLPQSIKNSLIENNNVEVYKEMAINSFKDYVSSYLTGVIINAMAFSITFVVVLILLWVICFALDLISKLPLLNQINKKAGLVAGLIHGLVVVWIFFILVTVFGSTEAGQKALEMIGQDQILSFIYNNNYLLKFITNITKIIF
ncbi:MAG TPA: CvpA family protein [Clostridiales bacterium]|nr:CvpA family protein [Clostridiales bacterium]